MSDSEHIINGQVVPYSGGRMHTDTASWRDATDLELEQQERINELEAEINDLFTQADLDKAIEQAKRETAEKCASILMAHANPHGLDIPRCEIIAIRNKILAVGGGE